MIAGAYMDNNHSNNDYIKYESLGTDTTGNLRRPGIMQASILFTVNMLLLFFIGTSAQTKDFYKGTLFLEYVLMFLPAVLFLFIFKYDLKKTLRLNKLEFSNIVLIILLVIFAIPVVSGINLVNLITIKYIFGNVIVSQPPSAYDLSGLIIGLVVVALTPAICEETMYRGVIMSGFEELGPRKAIVISALLFAFMHMDFQKVIGVFLLGLLIAYIVYKTDSIFAGMLAHFTNNAFSIILSYVANTLSSKMKQSEGVIKETPNFDFSNLSEIPTENLVFIVIVMVLIYLFFIVAFAGLLSAFKHNNPDRSLEKGTNPPKLKTAVLQSLWLIPGLVIVFFMYVNVALILLKT